VFTFAATYVMNTWTSWQALHPAGIVVHSVPPLLVYCAAEFGPTGRDRLTEAVLRAARMSTYTDPTVQHPASTVAVPPFAATSVNTPPTDAMNADPAAFMNPAPHAAVNGTPAVGGTVQDVPAGPVRERRTPARRPARKPARKPAGRRKLRADYVADARNAWTPGVHVTPAWVREVTDCSRGMSSQVAADLTAELDHPHRTGITPNTNVLTEGEAA
jgi:hypothetical protein